MSTKPVGIPSTRRGPQYPIPDGEPIPWPHGPVTLLLALMEAKRRQREARRAASSEPSHEDQ